MSRLGWEVMATFSADRLVRGGTVSIETLGRVAVIGLC
ncbi:hypothetical protein HMPREF0321_1558 [Dermacoccus sp. Ellin185]|nr:hypothetical protein HMPREF0321_1558 [Dermacoccus sp. Ellin185]